MSYKIECGSCRQKFFWSPGGSIACPSCGSRFRPSDYGLDDSLAPAAELPAAPAATPPALPKPGPRPKTTLTLPRREGTQPRPRSTRTSPTSAAPAAEADESSPEPAAPGRLKRILTSWPAIILLFLFAVGMSVMRDEKRSDDTREQVLAELRSALPKGPGSDYLLELINKHHAEAFHQNFTPAGRHKPSHFDRDGYVNDLLRLVRDAAEKDGRLLEIQLLVSQIK